MTAPARRERDAVVVTGFDEASAVLRGPGWSSDPSRGPLAPPELVVAPGSMLFTDPPDHTRLRSLVAPAFAPRAVEALRPRVAAVVDSALAGLPEEADLLADFGYLVPLAVIAELLDVGTEGARVFLEQTPRLVRMLEVDAGPDDLAEAAAAAFEVTMFLTPVLLERRDHGGDDFISALLATDLSMEEVLSTCVLLLAAGHETTANLIGNGALALLRDPAQRPLLAADPARAVEELLRWAGPVKLAGRVALTDHEVGGVPVAEGEQVFVRLDAANRDPRRWDDPDRLDLGRAGPGHLAFGAGPHFCLGAALARMEAAEALVRLFDAYPGLESAEEVRWRASTTFHGLEALNVHLG